MTVDMEAYSVALDAFPTLDAYERADILTAVEVAPVVDPRESMELEDYFDSYAYRVWSEVRDISLDRYGSATLDEAAGFPSIVTKEDLLKALHRGARLIR